MEFKEVLYRAKEMDDTATLQIMETVSYTHLDVYKRQV